MVTTPPPPGIPDPTRPQNPDLVPDPAGKRVEMIRSEEQLQVGTATYATERVRVGKHVITEEKTITVSVRREVFTLERAPAIDSNTPSQGGGLRPGSSEAEYEVVLYEEQVVVQKNVVPVERVTLIKEVVTTDQDVTDQVRSERIETDTIHLDNGTYPRQ